MKVFLHNSPKIRIFVSLMSIALGGAIIGVASPIVFSNPAFFYGYAQAFDAGGGNHGFTYSATALIAAAAGGGLMIAGGLAGLAGHFARSQALLIVFLVFTFIGSLVAVVGGGMFLQVPPMVGERIYFDDTNSIQPPLQGLEKDMSDFEAAVFNECCVPRNWTDQAALKVCTGNNNNDCSDITDELVLEYIPPAKTLLCACASSAEALANFQEGIRSTGFCAKAQKATINAVGLVLPRKVPGNIKLQTIIVRRYRGFVYSSIPLIGYHRTPISNPDQDNARENPLPFGCGLGYQKGLAWLTDLWFQRNALPCAYGSLALGIVNIAFMVVAIVISVMQDHEEKDMVGGRVDKWDTVKDIPSTFANTANPIHDAIVVADAAPISAHNSSSSAQHSVPDKAAIFEQLREFYAKYDKGKSLADVEDVASWTAIHGMAAVNAKLMSKYKADLSSLDMQSSSTGVGVKALQQDLDI